MVSTRCTHGNRTPSHWCSPRTDWFRPRRTQSRRFPRAPQWPSSTDTCDVHAGTRVGFRAEVATDADAVDRRTLEIPSPDRRRLDGIAPKFASTIEWTAFDWRDWRPFARIQSLRRHRPKRVLWDGDSRPSDRKPIEGLGRRFGRRAARCPESRPCPRLCAYINAD